MIFNATLNTLDQNITNATLSIWFSNGSLFNMTTNILTGTPINSTTWNIANIPLNDFIWNVEGCSIGTFVECRVADSNFTFSRLGYTLDSQFFNTTVFETDLQRFEINITTIPSILSVDARLFYNGTSISATTNCIGDSCNIFKEIDIPLVVGDGVESQNKSFFWNITLFDGTASITTPTDALEQNVSRIHLEECDATFTTLALNFTARDEQTNTRIDPFYFAGFLSDFWLGSGSVRRSNSFSNTSITEFNVCLNPTNRNFTVDAEIEYNDEVNSTTYNTRNYFFQDDIINNITQHIPLFLLAIDDSTSFILKVQDKNLLPVADALIITQRLDVGAGNFTTVQISKTDENGQTVGFFKTETVDYRFIIKKNGVTLLETSAQKVVPESSPFTLIFTVGADEGAPWIRFEDLSNLTNSLTFNTSNNLVSYTYIDTSGEFNLGRLLVVRQNLSGISPVICDINSSLSSATLICDVGGSDNTYTASGFINRVSGSFLVSQIVFSIASFAGTVGLLGVFLGWFIILVSAFAFKFNEVAGIVLMNLAVILTNIIGLVNFGFLFIFGMMAVSIIIIIQFEK